MTTVTHKRQLMIARQQLDKLSVFIVNLSNFYKGLHPSLDKELEQLNKQLTGKPNYDGAAELSAVLNSQFKKDAKYIRQRNLDSVSRLESALKSLSNIDNLDDSSRQAVRKSLVDLKKSDTAVSAPIEVFERSLQLFQQVLSASSSNTAQKSILNSSEFAELHDKITQELKELIAPFYANDKQNKNLFEVHQKLNSGIEHEELLECCLTLIRHVIREIIQEANSTSKLIDGIHKSLIKIGKGLKTSIASSKIRSQKRLAENDSMQHHIAEMESVVSASSQLTDLKQQAQTYLDKMHAAIAANNQEEITENEKLISLMSKMQERIDALEKEAQGYQKKLSKQQANAMIDPLTKLPNRMAYEERLARDIAASTKSTEPLSMAIIDIDLFKSINDKYGHSVGDKTLQVIASNIRKHLDKPHFVARWGGEEFICLLANSNIEQAYSALEVVRQQIAKLPFMFKGKRVQVTVSIGLSQFDKKHTTEQIFEIADKNLYQAKDNGRNQTIK